MLLIFGQVWYGLLWIDFYNYFEHMLTYLSFPSQEVSPVSQSLGSGTMYFSDEKLALVTMATVCRRHRTLPNSS